MSVNYVALRKRIGYFRMQCGNITQEALASKINRSREYIVQIENGTKVPSLSVLVKIANTLSVSADELLLDCLEYSSSSYYKRVVYIDRSPAGCYNNYRVLWIGLYHLPSNGFAEAPTTASLLKC